MSFPVISEAAEHKESPLTLTLEKAISVALSGNRNLAATKNSFEQSKISLETAKSQFDVKISPLGDVGVYDGDTDISGGLSLRKKFKNGNVLAVSPEMGWDEEDYTSQVTFSLTAPLLKGGGSEKNMDPIYSSQYSLRRSERSLYLTKVNTVLNTVRGVYGIVELNKKAGLYRKQVGKMKQYARTAQSQEKVGLATPMDVYRAKIKLKDAEDSLTTTNKSLLDAEENLKRTLGINPALSLGVKASDSVPPINETLDTLVATAIERRIELDQAKDRMREVKRQSEIAEHNILPQLDLKLNYTRSGANQAIEDIAVMEEDNWRVSLLSTTELSRFSQKAAYRKSLLDIKNARLNYELTEDGIVSEVKKQYETLENNLERITIREEQIHQAEGKLDLAKIKFKNGMADNFDIIEAESEIIRAKTNLIAVKTDYIIGIYQMRAVIGTLIEKDGIHES